jgi:hypothetical protein
MLTSDMCLVWKNNIRAFKCRLEVYKEEYGSAGWAT